MRESERTVHETATRGAARERDICAQLVSDSARYSQWYARHAHRMLVVGRLLRRKSQVLELRRACVEQIHRAALVRHLQESPVSTEQRDRTLGLFYGVTDPREAAVLEHRSYLAAASSQLCAIELLALQGDTDGVALIRRYERAYAQYFGLFCERTRRTEAGQRCLLGELLPEIKAVATRLYECIVGGDLMPSGIEKPARPPAQRARTQNRAKRSELQPFSA